LDPGKRSQLGAHHTSREDILLIVEPVVIEPLQRRWAAVKSEALALAAASEKERRAEVAAKKKGAAYPRLRKQLQDTILDWVEELSKIRVLDPACGSGNFLYLALRRMLDLWHEVRVFCAEHGLPTFLEKQVLPSQLYGLEVNVYAQELASVVVWIGYLQWLNQNAIGWPTEPIRQMNCRTVLSPIFTTRAPRGWLRRTASWMKPSSLPTAGPRCSQTPNSWNDCSN
jgi:hypothetical protein